MAAAPAPAPARRTGAVPVATVACFRCHQPDRFYATHLCDLCEARKHALLGVSVVEVSIWYSFLMKELVGRAFRPGDARKDISFTLVPCDLRMLKFFWARVAAQLPPPLLFHLTPPHQTLGQAGGAVKEHQVRMDSCDAVDAACGQFCVEARDSPLKYSGAVRFDPVSRAVLAPIPPLRMSLRSKSRFATPRLKVKVNTVALSAEGEWRWPEGVSYAEPAKVAVKRWASTRLHALTERGVELPLPILEAVMEALQ